MSQVNNRLHRSHRDSYAIATLDQRIVEIKEKAGEIETSSAKNAILTCAAALKSAIDLQNQSIAKYASYVAMSQNSVKQMAKAAAAESTKVQEQHGAFMTAQDRQAYQEAQQKKMVNDAIVRFRGELEGENRDKASTIVQKCVDTLKLAKRAVRAVEAEANRPFSLRIGADPGRQAMIANTRVDVEAMGIEAFATTYADVCESDDTTTEELLVAAARPWLQRIAAEGVVEYRKTTPRASDIGKHVSLAKQLLNTFDARRQQNLPAEVHVAHELLEKLEDLYTQIIGINPRAGGGMNDAEFRRRYLTPNAKPPTPFAPADGWVTRWLNDGAVPVLKPWSSCPSGSPMNVE